MPKVKTCEVAHKGATFKAPLKVDSSGVFSIQRPGNQEDWPHHSMTISGNVASDVERAWGVAVRDLVERTKAERKVIVVCFDSTLRKGGKRDFFRNKDAMLFLECAVALETTTKQGDQTNVAYREHPDYDTFTGKEQPFPAQLRLSVRDIQHHKAACTVVEWSQPLEDMMVRACQGIEAIVEMLDGITATPEALQLAASQSAMLPFGDAATGSAICADCERRQ